MIQADLRDMEVGVYQGSIVLTSANTAPMIVPLTLDIQTAVYDLSLPVIMGHD